MRHDRPRRRDGRRTVAHPGPSVIVVPAPAGGRRGRERSHPPIHTLWSLTVETLLKLFSSDAFSPRVSLRGSGDGATCSCHAPSSTHVLACPRILYGI